MAAAASGKLGSMKQLGLVIGLYLCSIVALHFWSPHHNGTTDAHAAANAEVKAARVTSRAAAPSQPLAHSTATASKPTLDSHTQSLFSGPPGASASANANARGVVKTLGTPTKQLGLNAGVTDDSSPREESQPQTDSPPHSVASQPQKDSSIMQQKAAAHPPAPLAPAVKKTMHEAKPTKPAEKLAKPKSSSALGTPAAADGIREGPGGNNGAWAGLGSDGVAAAAAGQPRGVVAYAVTITRDGPCVQIASCFFQLQFVSSNMPLFTHRKRCRGHIFSPIFGLFVCSFVLSSCSSSILRPYRVPVGMPYQKVLLLHLSNTIHLVYVYIDTSTALQCWGKA